MPITPNASITTKRTVHSSTQCTQHSGNNQRQLAFATTHTRGHYVQTIKLWRLYNHIWDEHLTSQRTGA